MLYVLLLCVLCLSFCGGKATPQEQHTGETQLRSNRQQSKAGVEERVWEGKRGRNDEKRGRRKEGRKKWNGEEEAGGKGGKMRWRKKHLKDDLDGRGGHGGREREEKAG